jgi:hypothetical protein
MSYGNHGDSSSSADRNDVLNRTVAGETIKVRVGGLLTINASDPINMTKINLGDMHKFRKTMLLLLGTCSFEFLGSIGRR